MFVLVSALMVGAAELFQEREIIFPEAAAIALGTLAAPRLPWRTDRPGIVVLIGVCAVAGVAIVRFVPIALEWQLALAYLFGQFILLCSRTSFAPLISAVVLPVLLQTRSLVYPVAALVLTALVLGLRVLLEGAGLRRREPFVPLSLPARGDWGALLLRTLFAAILCVVAVRTGMRYLVCPPLLVAFTEFSRRDSGAMRAPLRAVAMLSLCAAAGAFCRAVLSAALGLPLIASAFAAGLLAVLLAHWQNMFLPPAAALALLAMLLPAEELALYPLQIVCGAAVFVLFALLCFHSPSIVRHGLPAKKFG